MTAIQTAYMREERLEPIMFVVIGVSKGAIFNGRLIVGF